MRQLTVWYLYCTKNVWKDQRQTWHVGLIKTINLSVTSYMDKNIQTKAGALTYNTLLAVVPALALVFAIARGFGFQHLIKNELYKIFPSQSTMIDAALGFVDKYLATASGGLFVGIGIVFLLWTLISLLRNIEMTFNQIWGVKKGRSAYRMITDYTTIIIILPILLICSGGISIFMSSFVQNTLLAHDSVLSPFVLQLLDIAPWVLTCLFFAGTYVLIPYTKVKFKYALVSGFICGSLYQILQYVFVNGQIYVTKYNAIYGSFSFLPLFMIWMYLTWLICIAGVVLTYSAQNIFRFNYSSQIRNISKRYMEELTFYVVLIVTWRFESGKKPYKKSDLAEMYGIPTRLVTIIVDKLSDAGFLSTVVDDNGDFAYQPAMNLSRMTVNEFRDKYSRIGFSGFIPELRKNKAMAEISQILETDGSPLKNATISEILGRCFS